MRIKPLKMLHKYISIEWRSTGAMQMMKCRVEVDDDDDNDDVDDLSIFYQLSPMTSRWTQKSICYNSAVYAPAPHELRATKTSIDGTHPSFDMFECGTNSLSNENVTANAPMNFLWIYTGEYEQPNSVKFWNSKCDEFFKLKGIGYRGKLTRPTSIKLDRSYFNFIIDFYWISREHWM